MAQKALVTVGTDGLSDWVRTPDGVKYMLGSVSVLKFVTELAVGSRSAKQTLDTFLAEGESMLTVDLERMWELLKPHRARWSSGRSIPLILPSNRTPSHRQGRTMADAEQFTKDAIANQVARIEAQIANLQQHAKEAGAGSISAQSMKDDIDRLNDLVAWLRRPSVYGNQSQNSSYYGLPEKLPSGQSARSMTASDEHAKMANAILAQVTMTEEKIDQLVLAGKKFDVARAKGDLHKIASNVNLIVSHPKFKEPEAKTALSKLGEKSSHLHAMFASAKV